MLVYNFYCTIISAHRTGIRICGHPFLPDSPGTGRVYGSCKLALPVKIAASMSHLEISLTGLFELYHITHVGSDP